MTAVELRNLAKSYGATSVLTDINLTVEPGDFAVVFGLPSSGKSVLMRVLTGLEHPDGGQILLRGADVTNAAPGARNIGYVPQSFALYPHYTVADNIAYPLTLAKAPKSDIEPALARVSELLGISELLSRKPDQLSGGQKQRVAIARGLIKNTDIYVLDDPLVGLDFKLRERLIDDLKRTQEVLGVTFVYTTSDAVEALMLARTLNVMAHGAIVESGPPQELYANPQRAETMRNAAFPRANFLPGTVSQRHGQDVVSTPFFTMGVAYDGTLPASGQSVEIGLRPEHVSIGPDSAGGDIQLQAKVLLREDLGGEELLYLDADGHSLVTMLRSDQAEQIAIEIDEIANIGLRYADLLVFADGARIGHGVAPTSA